mmetsp:Transcript_7077/g.11407  ORF Transcript_7077/g.11407 Transcript_7077/m.11407 type:complete len:173 (-) Transcript_7077:156-674(-)
MGAFPEDFVMEDDIPTHVAMAMFDMGPVVPVLQAAATIAPSQETVLAWKEETDYSEKYCDDVYEYRRVTVPRAMLQVLPPGRTMTEAEWRNHGITMSRGWEHYDHHSPEANVLLFRRVIGTDPKTGQIPPNIMHKVQARDQYIAEVEQIRQKMVMEHARRRSGPSPDQIGGA